MDLIDQLKNLFPNHIGEEISEEVSSNIWLQDEPLLCKYEIRKGKPVTVIEGYNGAEADFKILAKELKTYLGAGGTVKNDTILIQGDYRDTIMQLLKEKGFKVKRIGG